MGVWSLEWILIGGLHFDKSCVIGPNGIVCLFFSSGNVGGIHDRKRKKKHNNKKWASCKSKKFWMTKSRIEKFLAERGLQFFRNDDTQGC